MEYKQFLNELRKKALQQALTNIEINILATEAATWQLKAELEALRWVPVAEGLPADDEDVLTCENGKLRIDSYNEKHGGYWTILNAYPTHWMPIPELPETRKDKHAQTAKTNR